MKRLREEEEEEDDHDKRMQKARDFCRKKLYDLPMTDEEYQSLECPTEKYEERRIRLGMKDRVERMIKKEIKLTKPFRETRKENLIEPFSVEMEETGSSIRYMIDNYVHVTKFVNSLTGEPYNLNLVSLAIRLLNYYVEYSCKKFAKVNMRHFKGPSHLFYKSSVVVETGSDNHALSRRLLEEVLIILREACDFPHINIERRSCQNIVATGYFSDKICLNVLQQRFQETRRDKKEDFFKGVIIKERNLKPYMSDINDCSDSEEEVLKEGEVVIEDGYVKTRDYKDDGDDSAFIKRVNLPIQYTPKEASDRPRKRIKFSHDDDDEEEEDEEDDVAILSGLSEGGEEEEEEDFLSDLRETDEFYTHGIGRKRKRSNCTSLVFKASQIICTGCTSDLELHQSFIPLCKLLDECSESNPENERLEKELVKRLDDSRRTTATGSLCH